MEVTSAPKEDNWIRPFLNGSIASVLAETVTFPLDLAKTRLQIQGQHIDSKYTKLKYRGPAHAVAKIFRQEGILVLYSGLGPAITRQFLYGGLKRGLYETMQNSYNGLQTFYANLIFGFISGAVSAVLCNPVDIIKVRMQSQGRSFASCIKQLLSQDGVKGWFRGVTPNFYRTGVLVGTTFSVYDEVKKFVICECDLRDGILSYTISSSAASFIGTMAANPFDVVKSRMMNQSRFSIQYQSVFHCVKSTIRTEGISAFYKGCLTLLCRTFPWHFVFFLTSEYL